jgi:hypothetical protein
MAYAFRCKACNSLAEASHAGVNAVPAKCSTCGAGISFTPDGIKHFDEDNWVVLADLPAADLEQVLEYHGISADEIEAHVPTGADPSHEPVSLHAAVADGVSAEVNA